MTAENQNFTIYPGNSKKLTFTVLNQDDGLKPLVLTGSDVTWELYREPQHIKLLSKVTGTGDDVQIVSASEGLVRVTVKSEDTKNLKLGVEYRHYLNVQDSSGQVTTVATGKLIIKN